MDYMKAHQLTPLVAAVARALPPDWNKAVVTEQHEHSVRLTAPDGRAINFNGSHAGEGRIDISGVYPKDESPGSGWMDYGDRAKEHRAEKPGITVGQNRTPAAIAGEIARRFLPDYLDLYGRAAALKAQHEAYAARQGVWVAKFLALLPDADRQQKHDKPGELSAYRSDGGYIQGLSVGDSTSSLDLRSVPNDRVADIIRMMFSK